MEMKESQLDRQADRCLRTVAVTVPQAENITSQSGNNHSPKDMEQVEGGARRKGKNAKPFYRNVYLIKNSDFRWVDGKRYMPTLSELASMRKSPSQYVREVKFHPTMSRKMVMKKLEETFPFLKNRSYSCASKTSREDEGNSQIWNGKNIKKNTEGNSALYVLEDEIRDGLSSKNDSTSGESGCDFVLTDEELPKFDYEVNINPQESPLKGGVPCHFTFSSALSSEVESVCAMFFGIGTFKLRKGEDCYYCNTPASEKPGVVSVSLHGQKSSGQENVILGQTEICYVAPQPIEPLKKLVFDEEEQKKFFEFFLPSSPGSSGNSGSSGGGGGTQINGAPGSSKQSRVLSLLIYAAAKYGGKRFIEMIFNSSAGRVVFHAYKDNEVLPESVAKDHGNEEIAIYLEEVTKRLSEETKNDEEFNHRVVDWSELIKAAGEAQRKTDHVSYKEDMDELHAYSPDVELSSEASSKCNSPTTTFEDHVIYKKDMDELHGYSPDVELSSEASSKRNSPTTTFEDFKELAELLKAFKKFEEEVKGKCSVPLEIEARGPEAVEAYNKALTEGKTCIKRIPIMLIGQEWTGKTSLKRSMKGEKFDKEEESTDGIETDHSYFKVSTEIWKSGQACEEMQAEPEVLLEHLATAKVIIDRLKKGELLLSGAEAELESDSESPNVSRTKSAHQVFHKTHRDTKASQRELPEELARLVEKLLREGENADEDQIYSILWDFGGQSVYYDTHPIFLTEKAIYILVCDLSRDPDEKAIPPVKTGLFENKVEIHCNKTNLEYLDFWMSSIHSLVSPDVISSRETDPNVGHVLPRRLPPVFLVCTHADMPFGNSHAGDLARKMYGSLQRKTYQEHLYKDFFVVDNTKSGSEEECLEVLRLREEVLAVAREMKLTKEEIPVKWLRYENKLRTNRDKCITLEEAKRIASSDCGIQEEDEFSTLLNFLHDQRIVIHFSGSPELEKMVILDPQWLVDVFKNIITVKRFKGKEHSVKDLWIQLEETGILDEKLIDHAWKELLNSQESRKSFLAIMERLSLLSPWSSSKGSKQYLVPSMLMSPPTDDVLKLLVLVKIPSLFVTFPSCQVPPGLFSRIILLFLQWCREGWKSNVNPQLFRNFAIFHIVPDKGISVIFLYHSSFIEITLLSKDEHSTNEELTRSIYWKVRLLLERMRKEFYWLKNMIYEMCVCCPVCSNSRPGSVKCHAHNIGGCECLHFLSESDLRKSRHCSSPGRSIRGDLRINVEQFECWFTVGDEHERSVLLNPADQAGSGDEVFEEGRLSLEGTKHQELALPKDVISSLRCTENDAEDIVLHFVKALQLDSVSLENAEPETKRLIRNLASKAKCEKRYDVVNHLRKITAAGITGPLLNESLSVVDMPFTEFKNLTFSLSVGDKWKLLAESLGLSNIDIAFLGERVRNPAAAVLEAVGKHRHLSVGEIYDTLVEHEMPVIADLM